jgi:MFS family permease
MRSSTAAPGEPEAGSRSARPSWTTYPGLAPLASKSYRYLFAGTTLTMAGNFMQQVALGWLIYDLTSAPVWLGIVSFARGLPLLLLALPAGVVVDRFDRRRVLVLAQGLTGLVALVLAGLIATGLIQPWQVALLAFLGGCFFVLLIPARQALLPATVERSQLGPAIGLMSAGQNSGRVLGPSLAGVLIAAFGLAVAFAAQAAVFLLALLCSLGLPAAPRSGAAQEHSAAQDLLEGLRYVWRDSTVLAIMALQAIPAFLLMPYVQLLPIFARDILQAGPQGMGLLMTATGVGSVLGSLCVVALPGRHRGLLMLGALGALGLLLAVFAASDWLPLSVVLMGLMGVAQAIYLATNNTLIQLAVPDNLRGRVMGVSITTWGLMPLGSLPQGLLADWLGAPLVLAGTGLLSCLVVVVVAARYPALRRL